MGLPDLRKNGDGEAHQHTVTELLAVTTTAIFGALFMDGGMEAVASVLGDYLYYVDQADPVREHAG